MEIKQGTAIASQEEQTDQTEKIEISNDVIAVIAGVAVSEVQGVAGMSGGFAGGISEVLSGKKNLAKGIKVEKNENKVKIDVNIIVEYGTRIPDVAFEIQNRVKKAVENMTGLGVEEVAEEEEETPMQLVFSGGTKEMLEVDAHTLFYVEAEGNYIRVAYSSADKMQQKLVRATMKQAEEAVAACSFIVRCHRAFLVNIRTVVKVDGNSQGYRLRLEGCTEEVPVSRGYAKEIKTLIEGGTEG